MGRTPCCSKMGLNRGPWTPEEDQLLCNYIQSHGEGRWRTLPKKAGLLRCGKSCRLRWMNYLRPDVKRGQILPEEEDLILRLHRLLGNRWSLIAGRIPGRTDNEIKNYWNTHLSKKLISQGIDPRTHKPLAEPPDLDAHANNDADNNQVDSENNPQHRYGETGIVADNDTTIEDQNSQELGELPENSVTGNLHALNDTSASSSVPPSLFHGQALNQETSEATYNINATMIPYSNGTGDPSLYLRKNSVTNSYFMAPPPADSALQNNPSLHGSISRNAPDEGFPLNFGQSEMQQHQVGEGTRMGVVPTSASGDYYSDIFSYFLESFTGEDQLHEEANKHGAPLVSENRQTTSVNQLGCEMWSTVMSPPSQCP